MPPPYPTFKVKNMSIWDLVLLVIATEAATGILSKGDIFYPFRKWLHRKWKWLHGLIDCPYCTSIWVASFLVLLYCLSLMLSFYVWFKFVLYGLVIHRLSNILHFIIDRIDPHRIDLEKGFDDIMEKEED